MVKYKSIFCYFEPWSKEVWAGKAAEKKRTTSLYSRKFYRNLNYFLISMYILFNVMANGKAFYIEFDLLTFYQGNKNSHREAERT